jgi:microcystin degradation protein MlrC
MEQTFEEKVRALTFEGLVREMVAAVREEYVRLETDTFGSVREYTGYDTPICVGCVATNLVCRLSGKVFTKYNVTHNVSRANFIDVKPEYMRYFNMAIDALRVTHTTDYTIHAEEVGLPELPEYAISALLGDGGYDMYYIYNKDERVLNNWLNLIENGTH